MTPEMVFRSDYFKMMRGGRPMNVLEAMRETVLLADEVSRARDLNTPGVPVNEKLYNHPSIGYAHIREMYQRAVTEQMSEGKLNRWLGWMQCAICTWTETVSVDDMKKINARHA